jgi:hypothetical protein
MDENETFSDRSVGRFRPYSEFNHPLSNSLVLTPDRKVSQLLLVLHELDEALTGLEGLSEASLSEMVSNAILGCGIKDPVEASHAIGAVLRVLEANGDASQSS